MKYYNEIVPFELAKILKDAGYPQLVGKGVYAENGQFIEGLVIPFISAPTYADLLDWFIEQGLCLYVYTYNSNGAQLWSSNLVYNGAETCFWGRGSFERAIAPAIEKAIEIIKGEYYDKV